MNAIPWHGKEPPKLPHVQLTELGGWAVYDKDGQWVHTFTNKEAALAMTRLMPV